MAAENLADIYKRLEELEKKVQIQEDIDAIQRLQYVYMTASSIWDFATAMDCFADDATFQIGPKPPAIEGKEEIGKFIDITRLPHSGPGNQKMVPSTGHIVVHPDIEVDGDTAKGQWLQYSLYAESRTMQMLFYVQAITTVEYAKIDGKWLIEHMQWVARIEPSFMKAPRESDK